MDYKLAPNNKVPYNGDIMIHLVQFPKAIERFDERSVDQTSRWDPSNR